MMYMFYTVMFALLGINGSTAIPLGGIGTLYPRDYNKPNWARL